MPYGCLARHDGFIQSETFRGILVPFSGAILNDTEQSFQEMNQALREHAEQAR